MSTPVTYSTPPPAPDDFPELMPELNDVPDLLASGSYLVTRPGPVDIVSGIAVPSAPVYFRAVGSVVPSSGREILTLPEGLRDRETKTLITNATLQPPGPEDKPDLVQVDGVQFKVQKIGDWQQLAGFHQVIMTRVPS